MIILALVVITCQAVIFKHEIQGEYQNSDETGEHVHTETTSINTCTDLNVRHGILHN